jgi:hypothetical protein
VEGVTVKARDGYFWVWPAASGGERRPHLGYHALGACNPDVFKGAVAEGHAIESDQPRHGAFGENDEQGIKSCLKVLGATAPGEVAAIEEDPGARAQHHSRTLDKGVGELPIADDVVPVDEVYDPNDLRVSVDRHSRYRASAAA